MNTLKSEERLPSQVVGPSEEHVNAFLPQCALTLLQQLCRKFYITLVFFYIVENV